MNSSSISKAASRAAEALSFVTLFGLSFGLASCSGKSEAAPSRGSGASSKVAPGGSRVETENYTVEIRSNGAKAGQESSATVTLTTKGSYHINAQYPYKFKLADAPDGVTYPKPILQRADGTFDEKSGSFRVPFVAAKAQKVKIAGTLSLSVCSEANCLMDKQALDVDVDVQ